MTKEKLEQIKKKYPPFQGKKPHPSIHPGDKFGLWTVLYRGINRPNNNHAIFICQCECGNIKEVWGDHLRRGNSRGCGQGECHNKARLLNQIDPNKKEKKKTSFNEGYFLYKYIENNIIKYIGKTTDLNTRINAHKFDKLSNFKGQIYYFNCETETDMNFLEYVLINKYHPELNVALKNLNIHTDMKEPEWILY